MDISTRAQVQAGDGPAGKVSGVLVNPVTKRVTHLIVQEPGWTAPEVLVPIDAVTASDAQTVTLNLTRAQVEASRPLNRVDYLAMAGADLSLAYGDALYWPVAFDEASSTSVAQPDLPKGTLEVWPGFGVYATDGHVGDVDELVVDAQTGRITALVLGEGHLWAHKDVTIPVSQIDRIEEGVVHLRLSKAEVGELPRVNLKRPGQ